MIKDIYSSSPFLTVNQYNTSSPAVGGGSAVGMVRWSSSSASLEVWDGYSWVQIGGNVDVSLTQEAKELLEWAKQQRERQRNLEEKAKTNGTIRDCISRIKYYEEQLKIVEILSESDSAGCENNNPC